jgi:hypothetical protein
LQYQLACLVQIDGQGYECASRIHLSYVFNVEEVLLRVAFSQAGVAISSSIILN